MNDHSHVNTGYGQQEWIPTPLLTAFSARLAGLTTGNWPPQPLWSAAMSISRFALCKPYTTTATFKGHGELAGDSGQWRTSELAPDAGGAFIAGEPTTNGQSAKSD